MNIFLVLQFFLFGIGCLMGMLAYPILPDLMPIHWNLHGIADGWARKEVALLIIPLITLVMIGLFYLLPKIDPKKQNYAEFTRSWQYMQIGIILLFVYLHAVTIGAALYPDLEVGRYIVGGISVLFVLIGILIRDVRQNYWIGYKLPWTLENSSVWNATHQLGGKLFLLTGIIGIIVALCINTIVGYSVWGLSIAVTVVVPIIFSYCMYRNQK